MLFFPGIGQPDDPSGILFCRIRCPTRFFLFSTKAVWFQNAFPSAPRPFPSHIPGDACLFFLFTCPHSIGSAQFHFGLFPFYFFQGALFSKFGLFWVQYSLIPGPSSVCPLLNAYCRSSKSNELYCNGLSPSRRLFRCQCTARYGRCTIRSKARLLRVPVQPACSLFQATLVGECTPWLAPQDSTLELPHGLHVSRIANFFRPQSCRIHALKPSHLCRFSRACFLLLCKDATLFLP